MATFEDVFSDWNRTSMCRLAAVCCALPGVRERYRGYRWANFCVAIFADDLRYVVFSGKELPAFLRVPLITSLSILICVIGSHSRGFGERRACRRVFRWVFRCGFELINTRALGHLFCIVRMAVFRFCGHSGCRFAQLSAFAQHVPS